jgi:hypothetical protein
MQRRLFLSATLLSASSVCLPGTPGRRKLSRIAREGGKFVTSDSGRLFTPWGFNYDRDSRYRLLEEYWEGEMGEG